MGALFYPEVGITANMIIPLLDCPIIIKTINLADDWNNIEKDMLSFVIEKCQGCFNKMKTD